MYTKKEKDIRKVLLIVFTVCVIGQFSFAQEKKKKIYDRIKDLPEKIDTVYGTDIIPDQEIALQYAELILKKRYKGMNFEEVKPFDVNLIADGKVWDITVPVEERLRGIASFHLRINRNNGEILNSWVDK